ncbi:hypothetical protein niasHS_018117 [Heterodera schachtii]|uniref:Ubiquitin-like domain-containing protein n=1 Tax=Heterodera schachtii TaxID=97005 RepID=A0ABD2HV95_HETSC
MNHFGISAVLLMAMLTMLMLMPSSTDGFKIYVSLPVEVEDTDTVATLKQKISEITKIPPEQQTIHGEDNPNGHWLMDENKLKDYKIFENSHVYLWREFEIFVKCNGNSYNISMKGTDTVQNLKEKIKPRIAKHLDNFIGQIKLRRHTTDGTAVELRHNETLDECGINGVDGIDVTYVENAGGGREGRVCCSRMSVSRSRL